MIKFKRENNAFFRYSFVGGVSLLMHVSVLIFCIEFLHINDTISSSIGFIFAIFVNYPFQYYYTFKSEVSHKTAFINYIYITILGFFINGAIFHILFYLTTYNYILIQIFVTFVIFLLNFIVNKKVVFRNAT